MKIGSTETGVHSGALHLPLDTVGELPWVEDSRTFSGPFALQVGHPEQVRDSWAAVSLKALVGQQYPAVGATHLV